MAIEEGKSFAYMALEEPTSEEIKIEWLMDFCFAATDKLDELGMKRSELAKKLGKKPSNVSRVLSGRANITLDTMAEYAAALKLNMEFRVRDNHEHAPSAGYSVRIPPSKAQPPKWGHEGIRAETKIVGIA